MLMGFIFLIVNLLHYKDMANRLNQGVILVQSGYIPVLEKLDKDLSQVGLYV